MCPGCPSRASGFTTCRLLADGGGQRRSGYVPAPGRRQPTGTRRLYLAENEDTAWAEFDRGLAERGQSPAEEMPCEPLRMRVQLRAGRRPAQREGAQDAWAAAACGRRAQWPTFPGDRNPADRHGAQSVLYGSAARTSRCACACSRPAWPDSPSPGRRCAC
jgi:hypothetical protein